MRTASVIALALLCTAPAWAADVNSDYGLAETSAPPQATIVGTPKTFTWADKAAINPAASRLAAAAVNGKIYRIGGEASGGVRLGWTQEYDPILNTWTDKDTMPVPASNINAAVWNGKIYVPGGYTGAAYLTNLQIFDPAAGTWSEGTAMPAGRAGAAVAVLGETLYVIGGTDGTYQATVFAYDLVAQTWSTKGSLNNARAYFGAAAVGGKIYAVGGRTATADLAYNEEYDPATNAWTVKADMPTARGGVNVLGFGGRVYAIGGGWASYYNTIDVYNPANNTWGTETPMLYGSRTLGVANIGSTIYVVGGYNGTFMATNQEGDKSPTVTWTSPACCAVGVHPAQPIIVAFSEPMDQGSVSFSSTPAVSASMVWNAGGDTLTIDPDVNLAPSTNYVFQIYGNDQHGHSLEAGAASNPFDFITAAGDSLETIMGTYQGAWPGAPRMRGNFFLCDANTVVKEYKWYLDPADTLNLWFAIYEGSTAGGTFNLKFSRMVRTPDVTEQWYTTGPMSFRMEAGKCYFYAMVWDASVSATYFRGQGLTYPYPFSFGDLVGVCGYTPYGSGTPVTPPQDTLEVPAGVFSTGLGYAYYQQLLTIPENPAPPILVLEETPGDTLHHYHQAASNLGYATRVVTDQAAFMDSLYNGTPWTMALVNNYGYTPTAEFFDTLNHFLGDGGRMVFYTYEFYLFTGHPLFAALGASWIGDLEVPENVRANDPTDVLFTTPNVISDDLYWTDNPWDRDCIRIAPASGGTSVAWFQGYPGEAALVANPTQRALYNSFASVCYNDDHDVDGKLDMIELIENEIVWLLGPTQIGVEGHATSLGDPSRLMLGANYPNPFRTSTSISFQLPQAGRASLKVYNILGQTVATLVDGEISAGRHQVAFNARGLANGIYLYRLEANGQQVTRKLAVVK